VGGLVLNNNVLRQIKDSMIADGRFRNCHKCRFSTLRGCSKAQLRFLTSNLRSNPDFVCPYRFQMSEAEWNAHIAQIRYKIAKNSQETADKEAED
jgi:hypothetical protein